MEKMKRTKSNGSERKPKTAAPREDPSALGGELTARQLKTISAILEAPSMEAAARAAGVAKSTLYEWIQQEPFRAALEAARGDIYRAGIDTLKGAAGKAAGRLIELLDSRNENTRRLTAREILALSIKIDESQTLEKRLTAIEQALETAQPAGKNRLSMDELQKSLQACKEADK